LRVISGLFNHRDHYKIQYFRLFSNKNNYVVIFFVRKRGNFRAFFLHHCQSGSD